MKDLFVLLCRSGYAPARTHKTRHVSCISVLQNWSAYMTKSSVPLPRRLIGVRQKPSLIARPRWRSHIPETSAQSRVANLTPGPKSISSSQTIPAAFSDINKRLRLSPVRANHLGHACRLLNGRFSGRPESMGNFNKPSPWGDSERTQIDISFAGLCTNPTADSLWGGWRDTIGPVSMERCL